MAGDQAGNKDEIRFTSSPLLQSMLLVGLSSSCTFHDASSVSHSSQRAS